MTVARLKAPRRINVFRSKLKVLPAGGLILLVILSLLCPSPYVFAAIASKDRETLLRIEKDTARYFFELSHATTGLVKDSSRQGSPASIAATGFGLVAYAIAAERGWTSRSQAYNRVKKTLKFALTQMEHKRGFFYHFISPHNGKRAWGSEVSSIDTALFIAGALLAAEMFSGEEVKRLAGQLYDRIDWDWMRNGTDQFSHGWKPESGFLPYYWDSYNEHLILQALALGSKTHPPPAKIWNAWHRLEDEYEGHKVVYAHTGSLFTYQFPQAFIDFRTLSDQGINYFNNSVEATLANKAFCLQQSGKYKTYSAVSWGLTASLGPNGYRAYGARPGLALHDGTIAPYGAVSSLPFTPQESYEALLNYYKESEKRIYGKYGFRDAFNVDENWVADEWLGVDQGITVLMIENFLNQTCWKYFMKLDCTKRWIQRCGL